MRMKQEGYEKPSARSGRLKRLLRHNGWTTLLALLVFGFALFLLFVLFEVRDHGNWSDGAYQAFRVFVFVLLAVSAVIAQAKVLSYLANYPRRGGGILLLLLGLGFAWTGIQDGGRGAGPVFLVIGLLVLCVSAGLLGSEIRGALRTRRLDRLGLRREARIVSVQADPVFVNGRQRFTLRCECEGESYTAQSYERLLGAEGAMVPLLLDPDKPGNYRLLLEQLLRPEEPLEAPPAGRDKTEKSLAKPAEKPKPKNKTGKKRKKEPVSPMFWILTSVSALIGWGLVGFSIYMFAESHGHAGNYVMSAMVLVSGLLFGLLGSVSIYRELRPEKPKKRRKKRS